MQSPRTLQHLILRLGAVLVYYPRRHLLPTFPTDKHSACRSPRSPRPKIPSDDPSRAIQQGALPSPCFPLHSCKRAFGAVAAPPVYSTATNSEELPPLILLLTVRNCPTFLPSISRSLHCIPFLSYVLTNAPSGVLPTTARSLPHPPPPPLYFCS